MRFRFKAFGLHLSASACVLSVVLGALYLGWYHWPGWYLVQALHVAQIAALVDVALGPTLTLIVASSTKAHRVLARDIAIIATMQIVALVYGATALWHGRPLYYTFSQDRLEIVQASDIKPVERARAQRENPAFAPHWYSLPRWVWAPLPDDPKTAINIVNSAIFGGDDVIEMPRYFRPWEQGLPTLRTQLAAVSDIKALSGAEKARAQAFMSAHDLAPQKRNALVMYGYATRVLAIFDTDTLQIRALLKVS
jgi:hypothetical protein